MRGLRLLNSGEWNKPPVLTAARQMLALGLAKHFPACTLGDAASFVNGTSYDVDRIDPLAPFPIIRISNLTDTSSAYIRTDENLGAKFWIRPGDLLVSWSASFKSSVWDGPEGYLNQHIFKVAEKSGFDRRYVRHIIEASFDSIQELVVGIGMMHLRRADFLGHQIPAPPIEIQTSVAAYLDWIESGGVGCAPRLPPELAQQQRVVARIAELAGQVEVVRTLRQQQEQEIRHTLLGAFRRIVRNAPHLRMRDIAPLVRRPVKLEPESLYGELGVRSFGKGTFHKPSLSGIEIGDKRVFHIEPNDLLFSNVFAWEGAIAVAKTSDAGRVGSHRFITCVPNPGVATSQFLCFYFLTQEGLGLIQAASPGGALRNRTLGLEQLGSLSVPVPSIKDQRWFDALQAEAGKLTLEQSDTIAELDQLLPAILDRAFKGQSA